MTVIISGTDGVSDVDGTAGTPALRGTDANTGIFFPAADTIAFAEGGAEAMRIDSSGNVGIGTVSPTEKLTVSGNASLSGNLTLTGTGNRITGDFTNATVANRVFFQDSSTNTATVIAGIPNGTGTITAFQAIGNSDPTNASLADLRVTGTTSVALSANRFGTGTFLPLTFSTSGSERMRIDTSGNLLVGATTQPFSTKLNATQTADLKASLLFATNASFTDSVLNLRASRNTTNNSYLFLQCSIDGVSDKLFIQDSGNVVNANNSYGSLSDLKLKQDIVDASSQWDDIKGLRVRKFRYRSDPDGFLQMGLIAQEAELVSPGLIDEHPDYEQVEVPVLDDDGNPVLDEDGTPQVTKERKALGTTTKSVKYSVLYMKAVKALQEAIERIETLEASNTALEARIAALEGQ